ncbi:WS/DGAT/MGAT family O-acyltransferase [Mycolicibacterium sphagni]|uniref:Diacylglycerol O-acyltransferase n=1 Tax=Mycolicibacterium sphagni TaxID=1786 RepID=A0A255DD59_9MYCO|nr:wax ester/triacylglycerol synthase family O-acyltransferase [Mycolicibacterium sphagni]MCV7176707.1 wax ester/triacylglycerol synthase family O-acyltransferase [Mycolicibacterium sphagni]OYN77367.1 wax ester/triacylglycerol synthase family O-acyltransferase [Mycolicibacterium sphagni]
MELISPADSMFLLAESREHPMHVGGLQLFELPEGAGPEFLADIYAEMLAHTDVQPTFQKHPGELLGGIANLTWSFDRDIDLEYHLRRSALPAPGRIRELLELTSRMHGTLLDRHRPLWETHLVEGLNDGRVAVYTKVHHALLDGVSAMKLMRRSLSLDPQDTEVRAPWSLGPRPRPNESRSLSRLGELRSVAGSIAGLAPSALTVVRAALLEQQLTLPFAAPKTMFNVAIGGARRVAAQSWPLKRIVAIKEASGVTVNDVILAMCAGALRAYLLEQDALPDRPLIAMVPVNLRSENDQSSGGNQVGSILCSLATDLTDPADRLATIHASISSNKAVFAQLPRLEQLALSAFNVAPLALTLIPALAAAAQPPFNIVISNVPGAREPLYWRGARLDGNYPLSIALDGQALNITLSNNADNLDFGLVGCRRSIPHLQRLLGHLEDSLTGLEEAVGV